MSIVSRPSALAGARDSTVELLVEGWLDPAKWPIPEWYKFSGDRTRSFESFFTQQLRTRYLELEGDFRSIVGNFPPHDKATAQTVFNCLQLTRPALEVKEPDYLTVSSTLDLVERYMVWLCPEHIIETRMVSTLLKLETLRPQGWKRYARVLKQWEGPAGYARAPLDEAIAACNRVVLAQQIGSGLQIKRLRAYRRWGAVIMALLVAATPILADPSALMSWPVERFFGSAFWNPWLNVTAVLIVGMVGGFLSGLLQSRSSQVSLADYQETMLTLALRPVVGGIVSLVLLVLLSWKLIPVLDAKDAGAFFLAAFLSGFSERYFLRLLDLDKDKSDTASGKEGNDTGPSRISTDTEDTAGSSVESTSPKGEGIRSGER
jgi:hypothetical protein